MKPKYYIWIFLGLVFVVITAISFWGIWGAMVLKTVAIVSFNIFVICYPILWLIFRNEPKKKINKNKTKKYPEKMLYVDWSFVNGKPVVKEIVEKELKESQ